MLYIINQCVNYKTYVGIGPRQKTMIIILFGDAKTIELYIKKYILSCMYIQINVKLVYHL